MSDRNGHHEVVVITGASAGIGRATARAFARQGAWIGLIARGEDRLRSAAREVEALGGRALVLPCDVADAPRLHALAARVEAELGPIDVWVNDAMVTVYAPVSEMAPEEYRRVTDVTYLGYVHGTQAALRYMLPRDRGVIVQVGSALAHRGIPLQSAYCAAKHAIDGFCESLRTELLHDGSAVRVTQVHLPAVNTPQFEWARSRMPRAPRPVAPVFEPEVAADAIVWSAHHPDRRVLSVGLPTVSTIWSNRLMPGVVDRFLASRVWDAQMTSDPIEPDRQDNLWAPAPGDHAARGRFSARSSRHSPLTWLSTHRGAVLLAASAAAFMAGAFRRPRG